MRCHKISAHNQIGLLQSCEFQDALACQNDVQGFKCSAIYFCLKRQLRTVLRCEKLNQVTFNLMSNKKPSKKKEEERQLEIERAEEEEKRQEERKQKEGRLKELAEKSQPLLTYGLLDAYQFFLAQLANTGIPQSNVFEFAAQAILKFQKNKNKKLQTLREVEQANLQAVKVVSESSPVRSKRVQREIKPQILPFKGYISQSELDLLNKR